MESDWEIAKQSLKRNQNKVYDGKFNLTTDPGKNNVEFLSVDDLLGSYDGLDKNKQKQFVQFAIDGMTRKQYNYIFSTVTTATSMMSRLDAQLPLTCFSVRSIAAVVRASL